MFKYHNIEKLKKVGIQNGTIAIRVDDGDILINQTDVSIHSRGERADCVVSATSQVIIRIIKKQQR